MEITVMMPCMRLPSVNELYLHNRETGDVFRNPDTVKMIDQMRTYMADNYSLNIFNWLNKNSRVHISYDFILKRSLWRRDVSNIIKLVQDVLTRYAGIDDSQVLSIYARKSIIKGNLLEYAVCTITDEIELLEPQSTNTVIIPVDYIPSINAMYNYDVKSHQIYKEPWIHGLENYIKWYLKRNIIESKFNFIKYCKRFRCYYDFFLRTLYEPRGNGDIHSRDVDNMIKSIEDSIFRYFNIDDHWVVELIARKHPLPNGKQEYVAFTIEPSDFDVCSFNATTKN